MVKERKGDDSPVYLVSPEYGNGRDRVVHRNLLLPCHHLPLDQSPVKTPQPQRDSQSSTKKTGLRRKQLQQPESDSNPDDDYGGDYQWHLRPSRGRRQRKASLNPLAEPEEDVPLSPQQSELGPDSMESGECEADQPQLVRQYPHRQRQCPVILSYEALGQPSLVTRYCEMRKTQSSKQGHLWRSWTVESVW